MNLGPLMSGERPHWPVAKLADIMTTQKGYAFKSSWYSNKGVPIVKVSNFTDNSVDCSSLTCIPETIAADLKKFELHKDDIVIQTVGSWPSNPASVVGKCVRIPHEGHRSLLNQNAVKILPTPKVDKNFLYYLLKNDHFSHYIVGTAQGAASQAAITLDALRAYSFPMPPREIQIAIGETLRAFDDLIEVNRRRVTVLEEMARGLFEEWFVRFRFPGYESLPNLDTPEGPLPLGWRFGAVSDAFTLLRGRGYRSVELAKQGGMPFVNLKCILRDGGFKPSGIKRYTGPFKDSHLVVRGDIVMAVTDMTQDRRIVGRVGRIPLLDEPEAVVSMDLVKVQPAEGIDATFLYCWLRYSGFGLEAAQHANGANVLHLSPKAIVDLPIIIPDIANQAAFGGIVEPLFHLAEVLSVAEQRLSASRDLLLPRLLSGQLSVDAAERELAEAA